MSKSKKPLRERMIHGISRYKREAVKTQDEEAEKACDRALSVLLLAKADDDYHDALAAVERLESGWTEKGDDVNDAEKLVG